MTLLHYRLHMPALSRCQFPNPHSSCCFSFVMYHILVRSLQQGPVLVVCSVQRNAPRWHRIIAKFCSCCYTGTMMFLRSDIWGFPSQFAKGCSRPANQEAQCERIRKETSSAMGSPSAPPGPAALPLPSGTTSPCWPTFCRRQKTSKPL